MSEYMEDRKQQGFTLIELLIAIVVVGVLTAVAIVGIAGLTNNGKSAACAATQDAAKAAQAVHYSNNNGTYPASFAAMTGTTPPELELSGGATVNAAGDKITGKGWTLSIDSGGVTTPLVTSCA